MSATIALGPFEVLEQIGEGGAGQVWGGVHRASGTPVAIKVVSDPSAREASALRSFRREVRAVASLDHPGVVTLHDHGTVSDTAARPGGLPAGSPYLVMELAQGGSLAEVPLPLPWSDTRRVLLSLLDALAYAHARGIVHRDLKPANVLVTAARDPLGGLKLADFGLAHSFRLDPLESQAGRVAGTPSYMAPEQLTGDWRSFGPWTDLYALGCLAYALAVGHPPFVGGTMLGLMMRHLQEPPPPLPTAADAPRGFEVWVRRLLTKDPWRRTRRAADAAAALQELPESTDPRGPLAPTPEDDALEETIFDVLAPAGMGSIGASDEGIEASATRAPLDWRGDPRGRRRPLTGAGLALFGLRRLPTVGRDDERDALWAELRRVTAPGAARAVVVEGQAGVGKSRLVEWLGQRAHELGVASVLHVTHDPAAGPAAGLEPALARALRCRGLEGDELRARAAKALGLPENATLVDSAVRVLSAATGAPRFSGATERHVATRQVLDHLALDRPLLLWVDDALYGAPTLAFVEHLLGAQERRPAPVLVVLTVRSERRAERPAAARQLDGLCASSEVTRISLGPLRSTAHRRLVEELLGLSGDLAARVQDRTAGNPLFATELVGDWVQRGLLEAGPRGFTLRPGASVDLPDDLLAVWGRRLDVALAGCGPDEVAALELAAALGLDPEPREWALACQHAGLTASADLADPLLSAHLARADVEGRWSFAHGMLREALVSQAATAGRLRGHHRACARMLSDRPPDGATLRRLGVHLRASGDDAGAAGPLVEAARRLFEAGELDVAELCLADAEAALDASDISGSAPSRGRVALVRCRLAWIRGDVAAGVRLLDEAARHGWVALDAELAELRGVAARATGALPDAQVSLRRAVEAYASAGSIRAAAHARNELAKVLLLAADVTSAVAELGLADETFQRCGDVRGQARCHLGLAIAARRVADLRGCAAHLEVARERFAAAGARQGLAESLNMLGDAARLRGDNAAAEPLYHQAIELFDALEDHTVHIARTNLALSLLEVDRVDDARALLTQCLPRFERSGPPYMAGAAHVALLVCAATDGAWGEWRTHSRAAAAIFDALDFHDVDVARPAQLAGLRARGAFRPDLAAGAFDLAARQYAGAGRAEAAAEASRQRDACQRLQR